MNNYFTPDTKRGTYERIVADLAAQMGLTPDQFKSKYKVMPSVLKMARALNPSDSFYEFSPRKGVDTPALPNTILLDQNDFFAIESLGIRIGRMSNTGENHGNYPLLTYADPAYFNGTGTAVGSEAAALQTLVNGQLNIQVQNETIVDNLPCQELFYNPDASYSASPLAYPGFGGSDGKRGMLPVTPQVILDASADNKIVVTLANGIRGNINGAISTGTTESTVRNIVYLFVYGWKIKNLSGIGSVDCARV